MKSFLKKILSKRQAEPGKRSVFGLPDNHRLYCIGDIHGRLDLLLAVHQKIAIHSQNFTGVKLLLYLGDYIDRGSQASQVIDCLLEDCFSDFQKIFLLGNHEQVLLQFLQGSEPSIAPDWFRFGGLSTLASYGVTIRGIPTDKDLPGLRADFANKLPVSHLKFYQRLLLNYEIGDYFFVHAGVRPKVSLKKQIPEDMLWIRDEFLDSHLFHGKMIVHGHHVTDEPVKLPNRIGLDTGAYWSGRLTCAVFEDTSCHFL